MVFKGKDFETDIRHPPWPCPFSFTAVSCFSPGGHEAGYGRQRKKDKERRGEVREEEEGEGEVGEGKEQEHEDY